MTASAPTLERTRRILEAERKDGYRDRVVVGGLAVYARNLQAELAAASDPAAGLPTLLADYGAMAPETRAEVLQRALALLGSAPASVQAPVAARAGGTRLPTRAGRTAPALGSTPGAGVSAALQRPATRPPTQPTSLGPRPAVQVRAPPPGVSLDTTVAELKGIGPQRGRLYGRLGLRTVRDLLFHFPARHLSYPPPYRMADLFFLAEGSTEGVVEKVEVEHLPRGLTRLRATLRDETGAVGAVWLRRGSARLGIRPGERVALSGKLLQTGRQLTFENPDFEPADQAPVHTRGLVPVYPLTAGLFDKELRTRVHWAVERFGEAVEEAMPPWVRSEHGLLGTADALRAIHFPPNAEAHLRARHRFAFEEHLAIQLTLLQRRNAWQGAGAEALPRHRPALQALVGSLPFALTAAQQRVTDEILGDLELARPMTRLVQGEVGSGKTAVAALALLNAVANGRQGTFMAPTEILAEQHFATLSRLFEAASDALVAVLGKPVVVRLLTGSVKGQARAGIYAAVESGQVDILVGTQALIQGTLNFERLGFIVVDEQHRFGVKQREALRQKVAERAAIPHLLVMTATPIPRTLALSLFGDLDLSVIDELPPGRQTVRTVLLGATERGLAYERVRRAAEKGQQAFIVCPLVEESEVLEAKAATEEYERLRTGELASLRLGLLHGRMKPAEKDERMRAFRDGGFDVLVSTAVVEVGVDIPNATVMLIEGAERFGLAQLHQFRGRVGRGDQPSVCVLLTDLPDPYANERLRIVERSSNGLELAEHDLRLRGAGDYFGIRQSGFPELKVARLDDVLLVEQARAAATRILQVDADLTLPEHAPLRRSLDAFAARFGEPS